MSGKTAKKFRKEARKRIKELWAKYWFESDKYPFWDRWYVAWRIIKGRDKLFRRRRQRT